MAKETQKKPPSEMEKVKKAIEKQTGGKVKLMQLKLNPKRLVIWLVVLFLVMPFFVSLFSGPLPVGKVGMSQLLTDIKEGKVEKIEVEEERLLVQYKDKEGIVESRKESGESFTEILDRAGIEPTTVNYENKDTSATKAWSNILEILLPVVLTGIIFLYLFRQARGAQDGIFSFGRSRAKLFMKGKQNVTFKDVAGVDEAKKELEEIVDFLKHPKKYKDMGARTPKGVILIGPSGCGKTLLAKAVAGEANVTFFSMAGSEFMEMLVGVGASRVRDLFETAKRKVPAIIFIDEIDAIGRQRSRALTGGHDEREQTLNQILVEMDGFTPNEQVIVLAASVGGETPILIKKGQKVNLVEIGDLVDSYYQGNDQQGEVEAIGLEALGMERLVAKGSNFVKNRLYFKNSAFKNVRAVFRHKVKEIYEIKYLGGKIRTTGNHSVFVRTNKGLETKAVSQLKKGDLLVELPLKVNRNTKTKRQIRAHEFDQNWFLKLSIADETEIDYWQPRQWLALKATDLSQSQIAQQIGVSQTTVSNWQRGKYEPRAISQKYFKHQLTDAVAVTPQLMRLLGYYTAEGYARWEIDFCFSVKETELIKDLISLMEQIFGLQPDTIRHITPGAVNVVYQHARLAKWFKKHCGVGAAQKHIPEFLWEAPFEYYREYLKGLFAGDGYEDKKGKGEITSVSERLIRELKWLSALHGVKTYMHSFTAREGRIIHEGKPLKAVKAYRLGWGRGSSPFRNPLDWEKAASRRAKVIDVKKLLFSDYVYDLCGLENEAFFGGDGPILLHNTNRGDLLDPALIRPGRFDRRIILDMPDIEDRKKIIKIHAQGKPFTEGVDWEKLSKRTVGFSGADIENMLNEAAILAARGQKKAIDMKDLEEAALKVKLGSEKKLKQTKEDLKLTAYHEAGHAVVTYYLPKMDPVHRISIVARGSALGHTLIPPRTDRYTETRSYLLAQITSLMGGRTAEKLKFNELTGGAASDIGRATEIARNMVVKMGMSDLGPINLGPKVDVSELGLAWYEPEQVSESMLSKVDAEIKKIVDECGKKAEEILLKNRNKLDQVAESLLKKETLEAEEFEAIMSVK